MESFTIPKEASSSLQVSKLFGPAPAKASLASCPPEIIYKILKNTIPGNCSQYTYSQRQQTLRPLSLVCKTFQATIGPLLYHYVKLDSEAQGEAFRKVLASFGERASHAVRTLRISSSNKDSSSDILRTLTLASILSMCGNLEESHLMSEVLDDNVWLSIPKTLKKLVLGKIKLDTSVELHFPNVTQLVLFKTTVVDTLFHPFVFPELLALGLTGVNIVAGDTDGGKYKRPHFPKVEILVIGASDSLLGTEIVSVEPTCTVIGNYWRAAVFPLDSLDHALYTCRITHLRVLSGHPCDVNYQYFGDGEDLMWDLHDLIESLDVKSVTFPSEWLEPHPDYIEMLVQFYGKSGIPTMVDCGLDEDEHMIPMSRWEAVKKDLAKVNQE